MNDKIEIDNGFDPNDASDDADANNVAVQTGAGFGYDQLQGSGMGCQLGQQNSANHSALTGILALFAALVFRMRCFVRKA